MAKRSNLFVLLVIMVTVAGLMLLRTKPANSPTSNQSTLEVVATQNLETLETKTDQEPRAPAETSNKTTESSTVGPDKKAQILDEIFTSKNDSDPRMDTILNNLTEDDKRAFEQKYYSYRREALNERGTIVFLLGRNITTLNDLSFMKQVVQEKPCSTLSNCEDAYRSDGNDHSAANDITLAYPQIMALKSMERIVNSTEEKENLKSLALEILNEASLSPHPKVKEFAQQIIAKMTKD